MYRSLNPSGIGILARQSELLEIALTHRFLGLEVDIQEVLRRAQTSGPAAACRYLVSAKVKIGSFDLPVDLQADDAKFEADLAKLTLVLEVAKELSADRCLVPILPYSEQLPFHENFARHASRLQKLAEILQPAGLKLGLHLLVNQPVPEGAYEFITTTDQLLTLVKSIPADNVGIVLDTWNWVVAGGSFTDLDGLAKEQILGVLLVDGPAAKPAAEWTAEERLVPGVGGQIDFVSLLSQLEQMGYDGPVALAPDHAQLKGPKREEIVARVASVIDELFAAAGVAGNHGKRVALGAR